MRMGVAWRMRRSNLRRTPLCLQVILGFILAIRPPGVGPISNCCITLPQATTLQPVQFAGRSTIWRAMPTTRTSADKRWWISCEDTMERQYSGQRSPLNKNLPLLAAVHRNKKKLKAGILYTCLQRDDLSSLPFTTMCIRESLRLHSPVQAVTRKYTQDLALPGGCTVPRGENKYKMVPVSQGLCWQQACVPEE